MEPEVVAQKGEEIYERQYRAKYEGKYHGKCVLIDLQTERAFVGEDCVETHSEAVEQGCEGPFWLLRVGHRAAYESL